MPYSCHMRTTVELEAELLDQARAASFSNGITLRQFFIDAVQSHLSPQRRKFRRPPPVFGW